MKRRFHAVVLLVASIAMLSGCQTAGPRSEVGGLGGAAAGGLLAASVGADAPGIAAGVILGGLLGTAIGGELDRRDRYEADRAAYEALENGRSGTGVAWRNPDSGHYGAVTPVRTYERTDGQYCREYQQVVTVDGQEQLAHGTACRESDGSWRITN